MPDMKRPPPPQGPLERSHGTQSPLDHSPSPVYPSIRMDGLSAAPDRAGPERFLGRLGRLADPTRLRLLALLERHELGVIELCEALRLPQSP